jgi:cytosine/creatinine deaminase
MANALFVGSSPIEENSVIPTRKTSRANSTTTYRRTSRGESTSFSHVAPIAHAPFIAEALAEAQLSLAEGGIPIGCVLVRQGQVVARGHNRRIQRNSVISHAEIDCLEAAGRQTPSFYRECTLYTTVMSVGAIRFHGIPRIVIGNNKTYQGDEETLRTSHVQVDVLDSHECEDLLVNYVRDNKALWDENIGRSAQ